MAASRSLRSGRRSWVKDDLDSSNTSLSDVSSPLREAKVMAEKPHASPKLPVRSSKRLASPSTPGSASKLTVNVDSDVSFSLSPDQEELVPFLQRKRTRLSLSDGSEKESSFCTNLFGSKAVVNLGSLQASSSDDSTSRRSARRLQLKGKVCAEIESKEGPGTDFEEQSNLVSTKAKSMNNRSRSGKTAQSFEKVDLVQSTIKDRLLEADSNETNESVTKAPRTSSVSKYMKRRRARRDVPKLCEVKFGTSVKPGTTSESDESVKCMLVSSSVPDNYLNEEAGSTKMTLTRTDVNIMSISPDEESAALSPCDSDQVEKVIENHSVAKKKSRSRRRRPVKSRKSNSSNVQVEVEIDKVELQHSVSIEHLTVNNDIPECSEIQPDSESDIFYDASLVNEPELNYSPPAVADVPDKILEKTNRSKKSKKTVVKPDIETPAKDNQDSESANKLSQQYEAPDKNYTELEELNACQQDVVGGANFITDSESDEPTSASFVENFKQPLEMDHLRNCVVALPKLNRKDLNRYLENGLFDRFSNNSAESGTEVTLTKLQNDHLNFGEVRSLDNFVEPAVNTSFDDSDNEPLLKFSASTNSPKLVTKTSMKGIRGDSIKKPNKTHKSSKSCKQGKQNISKKKDTVKHIASSSVDPMLSAGVGTPPSFEAQSGFGLEDPENMPGAFSGDDSIVLGTVQEINLEEYLTYSGLGLDESQEVLKPEDDRDILMSPPVCDKEANKYIISVSLTDIDKPSAANNQSFHEDSSQTLLVSQAADSIASKNTSQDNKKVKKRRHESSIEPDKKRKKHGLDEMRGKEKDNQEKPESPGIGASTAEKMLDACQTVTEASVDDTAKVRNVEDMGNCVEEPEKKDQKSHKKSKKVKEGSSGSQKKKHRRASEDSMKSKLEESNVPPREDISEKKESETAAREDKSKNEGSINTSRDAMPKKDGSGDTSTGNKSVKETGKSRKNGKKSKDHSINEGAKSSEFNLADFVFNQNQKNKKQSSSAPLKKIGKVSSDKKPPERIPRFTSPLEKSSGATSQVDSYFTKPRNPDPPSSSTSSATSYRKLPLKLPSPPSKQKVVRPLERLEKERHYVGPLGNTHSLDGSFEREDDMPGPSDNELYMRDRFEREPHQNYVSERYRYMDRECNMDRDSKMYGHRNMERDHYMKGPFESDEQIDRPFESQEYIARGFPRESQQGNYSYDERLVRPYGRQPQHMDENFDSHRLIGSNFGHRQHTIKPLLGQQPVVSPLEREQGRQQHNEGQSFPYQNTYPRFGFPRHADYAQVQDSKTKFSYVAPHARGQLPIFGQPPPEQSRQHCNETDMFGEKERAGSRCDATLFADLIRRFSDGSSAAWPSKSASGATDVQEGEFGPMQRNEAANNAVYIPTPISTQKKTAPPITVNMRDPRLHRNPITVTRPTFNVGHDEVASESDAELDKDVIFGLKGIPDHKKTSTASYAPGFYTEVRDYANDQCNLPTSPGTSLLGSSNEEETVCNRKSNEEETVCNRKSNEEETVCNRKSNEEETVCNRKSNEEETVCNRKPDADQSMVPSPKHDKDQVKEDDYQLNLNTSDDLGDCSIEACLDGEEEEEEEEEGDGLQVDLAFSDDENSEVLDDKATSADHSIIDEDEDSNLQPALLKFLSGTVEEDVLDNPIPKVHQPDSPSQSKQVDEVDCIDETHSPTSPSQQSPANNEKLSESQEGKDEDDDDCDKRSVAVLSDSEDEPDEDDMDPRRRRYLKSESLSPGISPQRSPERPSIKSSEEEFRSAPKAVEPEVEAEKQEQEVSLQAHADETKDKNNSGADKGPAEDLEASQDSCTTSPTFSPQPTESGGDDDVGDYDVDAASSAQESDEEETRQRSQSITSEDTGISEEPLPASFTEGLSADALAEWQTAKYQGIPNPTLGATNNTDSYFTHRSRVIQHEVSREGIEPNPLTQLKISIKNDNIQDLDQEVRTSPFLGGAQNWSANEQESFQQHKGYYHDGDGSHPALTRLTKLIKEASKRNDIKRIVCLYKLATAEEPCLHNDHLTDFASGLIRRAGSLLPPFVDILKKMKELTAEDKINLSSIAKVHIDAFRNLKNDKACFELMNKLRNTLQWYSIKDKSLSSIVERVFTSVDVYLNCEEPLISIIDLLDGMKWPKPNSSTQMKVVILRIKCLKHLWQILANEFRYPSLRDDQEEMHQVHRQYMVDNLMKVFKSLFNSRAIDEKALVRDPSLASAPTLTDMYNMLLVGAAMVDKPDFLIQLCMCHCNHPSVLPVSADVAMSVSNCLLRAYLQTDDYKFIRMATKIFSLAIGPDTKYSFFGDGPTTDGMSNVLRLSSILEYWEVHLLVETYFYWMSKLPLYRESVFGVYPYNVRIEFIDEGVGPLIKLRSYACNVLARRLCLPVRIAQGGNSQSSMWLLAYDVKSYIAQLYLKSNELFLGLNGMPQMQHHPYGMGGHGDFGGQYSF